MLAMAASLGEVSAEPGKLGGRECKWIQQTEIPRMKNRLAIKAGKVLSSKESSSRMPVLADFFVDHFGQNLKNIKVLPCWPFLMNGH